MNKLGRIMSTGILATVLLTGCSDSSDDKNNEKAQDSSVETVKDGKQTTKTGEEQEGKEVVKNYTLSTKEEFVEKWNKEAERTKLDKMDPKGEQFQLLSEDITVHLIPNTEKVNTLDGIRVKIGGNTDKKTQESILTSTAYASFKEMDEVEVEKWKEMFKLATEKDVTKEEKLTMPMIHVGETHKVVFVNMNGAGSEIDAGGYLIQIEDI